MHSPESMIVCLDNMLYDQFLCLWHEKMHRIMLLSLSFSWRGKRDFLRSRDAKSTRHELNSFFLIVKHSRLWDKAKSSYSSDIVLMQLT